MMELTARYSLEFNPFLKNSKEILYAGSEYKEALFRLDYLARTKGFWLLTGAPGRGKTTLVRNWCKKLNPPLYKVIYTSLSTVTVNDFYRNLAVSLGAPADEANYVSNAVLNDLKILFNFEMDSRDRAVILLVGLPQLNNTLRLTIHEPLRQRIIMNYNLDGLTKEEGREYISRKLEGAGCHQPVFEEGAIEAVLNAADGTARMISKLCNASLVIGNSRSLDLITADTVMQAINDSTIG